MKRMFFPAVISLALLLALGGMTGFAQSDKGSMKSESLLGKGEYIPDIATFMQVGACAPAGYSWDGRQAFFTSGMSGANQVYRILDSGWPYQLTFFEDGIDFFRLDYGADMGIVGASVGGSEQSQLYLMDTETGRVIPLTDFDDTQFGSVTWAPNDRTIYYRSNEENKRDFFVYRKDLTTGEAEKIFGDTTGGVRGYNFIYEVSHDGTKMIIGNFTSNVNNDLYLLDLETLEYQQLTKDEGDVYYGSASLMPDNETLWLTSNDNDEGISRLATMKVGTQKIVYTEDNWIDPKWEVEGVGFSRDFKYMLAAYNENGFVRAKLREVETGKDLPVPPLDGILGGGAFDEDGNVVFSYSGPTRAPDLWKWNPFTQELSQLTYSSYAGIDRSVFCDPKLVTYESFDGLEIPAFLYLPPDYEQGTPIPFIVHAHGGPEGQYQPNFIRNIQYLLLNGYGVLAPNPRGSSGYGRSYMNLDNYKNRKNSLKDYRAGVDWLVSNGYTSQGMIGIRGGSYGGYVVMGMITEYPDLFSAAVDIVGIVNFKTFLEKTKAYRRALRESEYGPLSDPEFLEEISPLNKADQIVTPLLVIHGENDPRVPVYEARQIIKTMLANSQQVDSLIFPDEGHGASKRVNIIAEYRKQVEFFDRYLKGMK